ncbi:glucuronate isomerase [Criibacterium bergeronii]|uniref:Uronate isomerase n=1 Tax=Criibacterium bergeronii TaxID=1871336 RepID=A0A552V379_9FIRM|nr:glucuronate isomerase [Criibacterium bergeronii]TRW24915.1 glucuronate isomerase [Criibacterium bergeronii]
MPFIDDSFLINNETGKKLYQQVKDLPICDYHCHLPAEEIAHNNGFKDISDMWLSHDHYKWRAMRIAGIDEKYITGDAEPYEKFLAFAKTLDKALGNPLYQWSHLELSKYFGIDELLTEKSAPEIWEKANKVVPTLTTRSLMEQSNVTHICTTDDPTDDLKYHEEIKNDESFKIKVLPTFRADKSFRIDKDDFTAWVEKLEKAENKKVTSLDEFTSLLVNRIDFFANKGCKLSDHGFEEFYFISPDKAMAELAFKKKLSDEELNYEEFVNFMSYINVFLSKEYAKRNWTMQMHIGALRNSNTKAFNSLGADSGFDSMGDADMARDLNEFLDYLDKDDSLPKTILYNLNDKDNTVFSSLMGNFAKASVPNTVSHGTAWWFFDQRTGIEEQLQSYANFGLLGQFVGMVTDSRSFLSYTRHDYFRRVLCNLIGRWAEDNIVPKDMNILSTTVKNICYNNAIDYFKF